MQHGARRAVAYVVARIASKRDAGSIYDWQTGDYHHFSGQVEGQVNVFDYERGNYLSGPLNSLYDYEIGNYLEIKAQGNGRFSGYDYESGQYFEARVSGRKVNLYDYETGDYYDFQI